MEIRYIKTKIDDVPKVLQLMSCNLCPLLIFNEKDKTTRCSRFSSLTHGNYTDLNVYSYSTVNGIYIPIKVIEIPDWCDLPSSLKDINTEKNVYFRTGHNKYDTTPHYYSDLMYSTSFYTDYNTTLEKLETVERKSILSLPEHNPSRETINFNNTPLLEKCSCCGKEKEDVVRDTNNGMCEECWNEFKENKDKMYFSFINNFRLKRKSSWIENFSKRIEKTF